MTDKFTLKLILVFSILIGVNSSIYSQTKKKLIHDYSRINKSQFHRLNVQYVDAINSNRPGFAKSAYNVGEGYFQIESGLSYLNYKSNSEDSLSFIGQGFNIRYAFSPKLEVFSNFTLSQKREVVNDTSKTEFSLSPFAVGLMYRFNNGEKLIPTISARGNVEYYRGLHDNNKVDLSLMFITQHQINTRWVFITNWKANRIITNLDLGLTTTITNVLNNNWAWFAEYNLDYIDKQSASFLNAGLSYLLNNNVQLDLFGGTSLTLDTTKEIKFISLGISWRLERKDKRKYNQPHGSERVDPRVYSKFKNRGIK